MEIYHRRPQKKCFFFFCKKVGHLAKHCRSRSVNVVEQVQNTEVKDRNCWRCGQGRPLQKKLPKLKKYQNLGNSKQGQNKCSTHDEAYGKSMLNQEIRKICLYTKLRLTGNPNSCIIRIKNQKYHALLDSGAVVSLVHSRIYTIVLRDKPKLRKQSALLQSVRGIN